VMCKKDRETESHRAIVAACGQKWNINLSLNTDVKYLDAYAVTLWTSNKTISRQYITIGDLYRARYKCFWQRRWYAGLGREILIQTN
jgi:hypothetical protein